MYIYICICMYICLYIYKYIDPTLYLSQNAKAEKVLKQRSNTKGVPLEN